MVELPGVGVFPNIFAVCSKFTPEPDDRALRGELVVAMRNMITTAMLVPGTAKTSIAMMYIDAQPKAEMLNKRMNFSSATTPLIFQRIIESSVEKRRVGIRL